LRDAEAEIMPVLPRLKRVEKYDAIYKEDEGIWCHDRNGRPYFNPGNWRRYGLVLPNQDDTEETNKTMETWHVAYHGTRSTNVDSIVKHGLVPVGTKLADFLELDVGNKIPLYVSPSISYSSHYAFTSPAKSGDDYIYCVFQVRVRPGSFTVLPNSLKDEDWGNTSVLYDRAFGPDELEWLVPNPSDVRVTGLMVRKDRRNPQTYVREIFAQHNELCARVRAPGRGKWYWNCQDEDTLDENGQFKPYMEEESNRIERAYQHWQSYFYLGHVNTTRKYFINFNEMQQVNCADNTLKRSVKRVV